MVKEIVVLEFGSKLYGTQVASSDVDLKTVFLPSAKSLLLGRPEKHFSIMDKKDPDARSQAGERDLEGFSIARFLEMVVAGQTMAMDMLFAPKENILRSSELWEEIANNRHRLVSKRVEPFVGYCRTQMAKYCMKTERLSAVRAVVEELELLPQKAYLEEYAGSFKEHVEKFPGIVEITDSHLECCGRKADLNSMVERATLIFKGVLAKYGERTKRATENLVDWKSVYHAVRVCHEAEELLKTGQLTFPRPEAKLLLEIRTGGMFFEKVQELIEEKVQLIEELLPICTLSDTADMKLVEELIMRCHWLAMCSRLEVSLSEE